MNIIDREGIAKLLDGFLADRCTTVYAPVMRGGVVVFDRISSGSEALLDFSNSKVPPKQVVMPQMQTLLTSAGEGQDAVAHAGVPGPIVLFGVRPCDARAIAFLDRVFGGGRERDTYYMARREALTVISLGCVEPRPTCFCETTGGGPLSAEGSDILLEPSGEGWVVRVVSEKGRVASSEGRVEESGIRHPASGVRKPESECFSVLLLPETEYREPDTGNRVASGEWGVAESGIRHQASGVRKPESECFSVLLLPETEYREPDTGNRRAVIEPGVDLDVLKESLDRGFDDPRWHLLTEKCLGCGACSFLCPTCHCFDIVDEEDGGVRSRSRIWDSCQFPSFTSQASGFNPRPSGVERFRQRLMHKFSYCVENYGMPGCVGCGRCVSGCPVNLDIRQLMAAFQDGGGN